MTTTPASPSARATAQTTTPTAPRDARTIAKRPEREQVLLGAEPPMSPPSDPRAARPIARGMIPALTGVRVVLAAWLVCHHLIRWLANGTPIVAADYGVLRQGQAATCGFFVLAGIGLYWAYGERLAITATLEEWGRYLRRRWAAVAPLGLLGAMLAIPYELMADIMQGAELWVTFVLNALLVQGWIPTGGGDHGVSLRFDGPTWTLSALLLAYAVFPLVAVLLDRVWTSRRAVVALGVVPWLAIVALAWAYADQPLGTWLLHVSPITRLADVLAGVAIGCWIVRWGRPSARVGWVLQPLAAALLVAAAQVASLKTLDKAWYYGAWYIPPIALLMYALTAHGGPLVSLFAWRRLERPGRVAFAVLMLHVPMLSLGWELGLVSPDRPVAIVVLLGACLALSWLVHLKVERPLVRRIAGPSGALATSTAGR